MDEDLSRNIQSGEFSGTDVGIDSGRIVDFYDRYIPHLDLSGFLA